MVARLRALLGSDLIGVFAGGSFALGGYEPGRSDLDVAAVCRRTLADETKKAIASALRHELLPCPARGLEFVLYAESTVRQPSRMAGYELDLNSGRAMRYRLSLEGGGDVGHWYAIDRAILREHGVVLFGPPACELFATLSREDLLWLMSASVRWHRTSLEPRGDDAILNACRAWRYAVEGVWSSKREAGEWASHRLDDASSVSDAPAAGAGTTRLDRECVDAFMARVQGILGAAAASASESSHS